MKAEFLHNAGNDVAYTAIAAFLLASRSLDTTFRQHNGQFLLRTLKARARRDQKRVALSNVNISLKRRWSRQAKKAAKRAEKKKEGEGEEGEIPARAGCWPSEPT
jgi:ribonuclease I